MKCPFPIILRNKDGLPFSVPCGKCFVCLQKKSTDWSTRLSKEIHTSLITFFCTLTYNDDNVPLTSLGNKTLRKRDIQLFNKRLRIKFKRLYDIKYRFFICGEYGPRTCRPHYHGLFFFNSKVSSNTFRRLCEDCWSNGFIQVEKADANASNYVSKYVTKFVQLNVYDKELEPTFGLQSRRPGIGFAWCENSEVKNFFRESKQTFTRVNGYKVPLPRYFKDKLFNESERNEMFLEYLSREADFKKEYDKIINQGVNTGKTRDVIDAEIVGFLHSNKMFANIDEYYNYRDKCLNKLKLKGKL